MRKRIPPATRKNGVRKVVRLRVPAKTIVLGGPVRSPLTIRRVGKSTGKQGQKVSQVMTARRDRVHQPLPLQTFPKIG